LIFENKPELSSWGVLVETFMISESSPGVLSTLIQKENTVFKEFSTDNASLLQFIYLLPFELHLVLRMRRWGEGERGRYESGEKGEVVRPIAKFVRCTIVFWCD